MGRIEAVKHQTLQYVVNITYRKKAATSLEVQCLSICTSKTGATGLIPGWETDIHMPCGTTK